MSESAYPPDDADLQTLEALRRDLVAAAERAVASGAKPVDVITCFGMALGAFAHHMRPSPPDAVLGSMMGRLVAAGRQEEAERLIGSGLQAKVYGGEARRRRRA
jgi:hypothetical protein